MRYFEKQIILTEEKIDEASVELVETLKGWQVGEKHILKFRLILEDVLFNWIKQGVREESVFITSGRKIGGFYLNIRMDGKKINPFEWDLDEFGSEEFGRGMLSNLGLEPYYDYSKGTNRVSFNEKKQKMNMMVKMILAIFLAGVSGFLLLKLPQQTYNQINEDVFSVIFNCLMSVLKAIAGPMIFFSVLWGICDIGDADSISKIGKKIFGRFLGISLLASILAVGIGAMLYPIRFFSSFRTGGGAKELFQMIVDIIPGNFLQPFVDGNTMQIIVLAIVLGIVILILQNKVAGILEIVRQLNMVMQFLMKCFCNFVPVIIYVSVVQIVLSGTLNGFLNAGGFFIVFVASTMILLVVYLGCISISKSVSPITLLKKMLPVWILALTTASSTAAFESFQSTSVKKLGVSEKLCNFTTPIGMVTFMPCHIIMNAALGMFLANTYHIEMGFIWVLMLIMVTTIIGIAAPPIPGGAIACFTLLFAQLSIPAEALAIAIALNVVVDFFDTAGNVAALQMELILVSDELDMLDKERLRSK